jgi:hypothetical protein
MKAASLDPDGWLIVMADYQDWMSTLVLYGTEEGRDLCRRRSFR